MATSMKLIIASLLMFTWLFLAQSQQDENSASDRSIFDFTKKGLRQLESYATATAENKIGGRNMGLLHKGNDHGVPGQAEGKWVSNMDYKPSVGHYFSEEIDNDAGFVAFSADYHTPRHHPPKNN